MAKATAEDLFDPADQESEELLPKTESELDDSSPDTNGDPEGSEERATPSSITLPDYFFKKYRLDDEGKPTFNPQVVEAIMEIVDSKADSPQSFMGETADVDKAQEYYDIQVKAVVDGQMPLLEVDPQTTGINFLQQITRTMSEFASTAYDYQDSLSTVNKQNELPDWLIQREEKMLQLGRKYRILRDACNAIDNAFGLKNTSLDRVRVRIDVERRLQRLAEWNFNNSADTSKQTANKLNQATADHCQSVLANA